MNLSQSAKQTVALKQAAVALIKPVSSRCNLACSYCYYLGKRELYPWESHPQISLDTIDELLSQLISLGVSDVSLIWQGGEPTLAGLPFYENVVDLIGKVRKKRCGVSGIHVSNAVQTNGTLLNDDWAGFFARNRFLVGVSLDGPPEYHNMHRHDYAGQPSHARVMAGVRCLQQHKVAFNILSVVNNANVGYPEKTLLWFMSTGLTNLQFIPCVELDSILEGDRAYTSESINADQYGQFLVRLFDQWLQSGIDKVHIRWFDNLIQVLLGYPNEMCQFAEKCGYITLEYNGDCYPCDFFVDKADFLGNINKTPINTILCSEKFRIFSKNKAELDRDCLDCRWRVLCNGECPRYRFINSGESHHRLPYFCQAYKFFFRRRYGHLEQVADSIGKRLGIIATGRYGSPAARLRAYTRLTKK